MGGVERGEVALPADMGAAARALARPEDAMGFLDGFVEYGCIDADGVRHVDSLGGENFRAGFRTLSLSRSLEERIGACIEQTNITRYLLGRMGVACRTFCTRGYSAGHPAPHDAYLVHCFTIALPQGDGAMLVEHSDSEKRGVFRYADADEAIRGAHGIFAGKFAEHGATSFSLDEYEGYVPGGLSFADFVEFMNRASVWRLG